MKIMINYSSKWWYKLITILLICTLLLYFSIGIAPRAKAVVVSTVIVGTVLAAMAAAGIGLSVSGLTAQELTQWVSDKLGDWTTDIGGSIEDHINNNLITVTANGILSIGSAAAQGISEFISWLQTDMSLTDNSQTVVIQGTTVAVELSTTYQYILTGAFKYNVKTDGYTPMYVASVEDNGWYGPLVICNSFKERASFYRTWNDGSNPQTFSVSTQNSDNITGLFHSGNSYWDTGTITSSELIIYHSIRDALDAVKNAIDSGVLQTPDKLKINTSVITIPTIQEDDKWYIDVGADAGEDVDIVTDGVITDTLTNTLDVTGEVVEPAQEVVIVNEDAIDVNVDHHMIGFTNLPDFAHLNLNSIWHYVSDAVDFASSWLAWFVSFLSAMPLLAIPLYMSFTLLVVLSFLRRFV